MSPSWADGDEEGRLAEWAGVGRHKLARAQPKAAQYGASLPVRRCGACWKPLAPGVKLFCDAACEAAWVARI